MASKRLTINLPIEVWDRLDEQARAAGTTIGTHTKNLILARDKRQQDKKK